MKNFLSPMLAVVFFVSLCSFAPASDPEIVGTYGVSEKDPAQIELVLHADHRFSYQDLSDPAQPIQVEGTWEVKKKTVFLSSSEREGSYHHKWKIEQDGKVAKSRKGMTFYTLIRK